MYLIDIKGTRSHRDGTPKNHQIAAYLLLSAFLFSPIFSLGFSFVFFFLFEPSNWHAIWWPKYMSTHIPCGSTLSSEASVLKPCFLSPSAAIQTSCWYSCSKEASNFNKQDSGFKWEVQAEHSNSIQKREIALDWSDMKRPAEISGFILTPSPSTALLQTQNHTLLHNHFVRGPPRFLMLKANNSLHKFQVLFKPNTECK